VNAVRYGCLFAAAIVGWTIIGLLLVIPLGVVVPPDLALAAGLLASGSGAYLTMFRPRRPGSRTGTTELIATSDEHAEVLPGGGQPSPAGIDHPDAAPATDISLNPLAVEAEQALAMSRGRALPALAAPARRAIWTMRSAGALGAIVATYLVFLTPDSAEATFALSLFTIIGGATIGQGLRKVDSPKLALAGEAILGLGIGAALAMGWLFAIPIIEMLAGRATT
jgi:hypothetical protein